MLLTVDEKTWTPELSNTATLGDLLGILQNELAATPAGAGGARVVVRVELDGHVLDGPALETARTWPIDQRNVKFLTAEKGPLARSMVGKIAALIEYLAGQHAEIARLFEQNQPGKALEKLAGVLSAWQQIQHAFSTTLTMLQVDVNTLMVGDVPAADLIAEFCLQLKSIETALKDHDMVLLADILQYEMDTAVANWVGMLEATVALLEKEHLVAAT